MRLSSTFLAITCGLVFAGCAAKGGTITFSGAITQSTLDGTGPAVNNPSLNNIQDLQTYTVTLVFPGTITTPGLYDLTGSSLLLDDTAAGANETSFSSIFLTITASGSFDQFSLLACLTSGGGCGAGNQLDANFDIPAAMLNSQSVAAIGLDQPHPLDLLEDDGTTDIHGSITAYTGPASAVPEPSPAVMLFCFLAALASANRRQIKKEKNT
jgi:hypothetical protein